MALESASVKPVQGVDAIEAAVDILASGGALARFQGRGGGGAWGGGSRSVLVRADRPDAVSAARAALGRDPREEPGCVWDGATGSLRDADRCGLALRLGAVALRADEHFQRAHPAVVAADGRVLARRVDPLDEPDLFELLRRLHVRTGVGALACWPLATGREPPAARPLDAVRAWRSAGLAALWLGPHLALADRVRLGERA